MALSIYRLTAKEVQDLRALLGHVEDCPSAQCIGTPDGSAYATLDMVALMLDTAEGVEITYQGPEDN